MDDISNLYRGAADNTILPEYLNVGSDRIQELRREGVPTTTHELWAKEDANRELILARLEAMGPEARLFIDLEIMGGATVDLVGGGKKDADA